MFQFDPKLNVIFLSQQPEKNIWSVNYSRFMPLVTHVVLRKVCFKCQRNIINILVQDLNNLIQVTQWCYFILRIRHPKINNIVFQFWLKNMELIFHKFLHFGMLCFHLSTFFSYLVLDGEKVISISLNFCPNRVKKSNSVSDP